MVSDSSTRRPLYLRAAAKTTATKAAPTSSSSSPPDDDEFWRALRERMASSYVEGVASATTPADENERDDDDDAAAASDDAASDAIPTLSLPPAHRQLLTDLLPMYADLKGYDHTFGGRSRSGAAGDADPDGCGEDPFLSPNPNESRLRGGGGSWLMFAAAAGLDDTFDDRVTEDLTNVPGLLRVPSSDSESDSESDSDSLATETTTTPTKPPRRKGVSFSPSVEVQPIPHACTLSRSQRRRMYASSDEVRRNKQRNKREFRYDGFDWRNATEEGDMDVDAVSGELVHPVHGHREWNHRSNDPHEF